MRRVFKKSGQLGKTNWDAVIRVYDEAGNVIETHEQAKEDVERSRLREAQQPLVCDGRLGPSQTTRRSRRRSKARHLWERSWAKGMSESESMARMPPEANAAIRAPCTFDTTLAAP